MAPDTLLPQSPPVAVPPVPPVGVDEHPTTAIDPARGTHRDALSVLDHRARQRVVPGRLATPGHYLSLEDADGVSYVLPVENRIVHLGRASTADLRFEDVHVSRRHAIIVRHGSHVRLLDDRSSTGTFVNGQRIVACDIQDGDVIRLGPIALTYAVIR